MASSRFRSTYLLLGVFVVLLFVVLLYENKGADKQRRESLETQPIFTQSQLTTIDKIVFSSGESVSNLSRSEATGKWQLVADAEYTLDEDEGKQLLEAIKTFPTGDVVSRNKDNWENYGLAEGAEKKVELFVGEAEIATLYFGNPGSSVGSVHIRRNDDDRVYLVQTSLNRFLDYDQNRWRDKRVVRFDTEDIIAFTTRIEDETWQITQDSLGEWSYQSETQEISEQELVDTYLTSLSGMKGVSFESDQSLFESADMSLEISRDGEPVYVIGFDQLDDGGTLVQLPGESDLLRFSTDLSGQLRPTFFAPVEVDPVEESSDEEAGQEQGDDQEEKPDTE